MEPLEDELAPGRRKVDICGAVSVERFMKVGEEPTLELPRLKDIEGTDEPALGEDRRVVIGVADRDGPAEMEPLPPDGLPDENREPKDRGIEETLPVPLLRDRVLDEGALPEGAERMIVERDEEKLPADEGSADRLGAETRGDEEIGAADDRLIDRGAELELRLTCGAEPLEGDREAAIVSVVRAASRTTIPRHVRRRIAENMAGVLLRVGRKALAARRKPPPQAPCYEKPTRATRKVNECQGTVREHPL